MASLSKALKISVDELKSLSKKANKLYKLAKRISKPDGSFRDTYDAFKSLKKVHRNIKLSILDHVIYPQYLTGGLKGSDYKVNALLHTGAKIVINEDITEFFPSTSVDKVQQIWQKFFCFEKEVADCLTSLTTYQGKLPQGSITSSFLANLALWKDEPALNIKLQSSGIIYSRYVDDIAVSSKKYLANNKKTEIISSIYKMLIRNGYRLKRAKHEIQTSGKRMEVTKLSVNSKPGLSKSQRSRIRSMVHHIELAFKRGEITSFKRGPYAKVMGSVYYLSRFHQGEGSILKERLLYLKKQALNQC